MTDTLSAAALSMGSGEGRRIHGVLAKLCEAAESFYGARRAVLFVDRNNTASLAAHARLVHRCARPGDAPRQAGERHAMEWEAICFNVCMAAVLLIFAPAKSPQRDVQL